MFPGCRWSTHTAPEPVGGPVSGDRPGDPTATAGAAAGSSRCRCPVTRNLKFLSGQTVGSELSLSR